MKIKDYKTLLIYPPLADPTQPYVALPTLKASLKQTTIADWNIEGVRELLKNQKSLQLKFKTRLDFLKTKKKKSFLEKWELLKFLEAEGEFKNKWKNLLKEKTFFDWEKYLEAKEELNLFMQKISALSFPFEFSFNKAQPLMTPWDEDALETYLERKKSPFYSFYEKKIKKEKSLFFGLSLSFASQISETFTICSLIKKYHPHAFILIGGSALHQLASKMDQSRLSFFFSYADALCLYEGEPTFKALEKIPFENLKESLHNIPNILYLKNNEIKKTPVVLHELKNSPLPDYSDYDLKSYLAPSPLLLYAPTRGCYWNKCSFCYYGFNQTQTHCYREKSPKEAAKDLLKLSKKYKVKHFYLSGDVLSPFFAVELAKELRFKGISWSTDLRIEKYYSKERCQILYEGGLRSVAFGIESGSNRMLKEVINKGTTRELATEVNKNFSENHIATAWMTFLHHPKETLKDAKETLSWLEKERERLALFIVGEFGLTPGSAIYETPKKFNIEKIYYTQGDLFHLYPLYKEKTKMSSSFYKEELNDAIDELSSGFQLSSYPYAGAISTHHSFLYLLKYGRSFFKEAPNISFPKNEKNYLKLRQKVYEELGLYLNKALRAKNGLCPLSFQDLSRYFS